MSGARPRRGNSASARDSSAPWMHQDPDAAVAANTRRGSPLLDVLCGVTDSRGICARVIASAWRTDVGAVLRFDEPWSAQLRSDAISMHDQAVRQHNKRVAAGMAEPLTKDQRRAPQYELASEIFELLDTYDEVTVFCPRHGAWNLLMRDARVAFGQALAEKHYKKMVSSPPAGIRDQGEQVYRWSQDASDADAEVPSECVNTPCRGECLIPL